MLSAHDFNPALRRRRRLIGLAAVLATSVGLGAYGVVGNPALPSLEDPDSYTVTTLAPHVVVYSVPTAAPTYSRSHTHTHSTTDTTTDTDQDGSQGDDQPSGTGSAAPGPIPSGSSGRSVFHPRIVDGSDGDATVTNSGPSGTTTITNGHDGSHSDSSPRQFKDNTGSGAPGALSSVPLAASAPAYPLASSPSGGLQAPARGQLVPTPVSQGTTETRTGIFPPLQTVNGTPQNTADRASAPALPQVPQVESGAAAQDTQASSNSELQPGAQPVAQQASMLMQIQCPSVAPSRSLCFEAVNSAGSAASLPASSSSLGSLPVTGSPSICPASNDVSGIGTGDNAGTSGGDRSASGDDSSGSDDGDGKSSKKHKKKSKHGGHNAKDSADVVPVNDASGSPTVASCGLLGQAAASGATGGATTDLSATEAKSGKQIHLTGYSFQDNQGGNNAKISCPQIHKEAGGTGTYADPITVASGGKDGSSAGDGVKCGDRFYLPSVQRYVIVEDTGNTPSKDGSIHLDMWVADDPGSKCMNAMSGKVPAIPNPPQGLPVLAGPIGDHGSCRLPGSSS